jgi:hypothetical protein
MKVNEGTIRKVNLLISHAIKKLPLNISIIEVVKPHDKHSNPKHDFHRQGMSKSKSKRRLMMIEKRKYNTKNMSIAFSLRYKYAFITY